MMEGTLLAAPRQTLQYNSFHSTASILNQQHLQKQNELERINNTYASSINGKTNYDPLAINNLVSAISNLDIGITTNNNEQKPGMRLPGSWFYEVGPEESSGTGSTATSTGLPGECSPINDYEDIQQLNKFKLELGTRNITESVEVNIKFNF